VRELMQADDVDAVLARMEGDHFRHLSPVMRKLSSFDGPKQPKLSPPPPQPTTMSSPTTSATAGPRHHPPPPPPPPPEAAAAQQQQQYGTARRGYGYAGSRDEPAALSPSFAPHTSYRPSASSSAYDGGRGGDRHGSDAAATNTAEAADDCSPAARPPRPPTFSDYDPLEAYRRPVPAPAEEEEAAFAASAAARRREPSDPEAELRYHDIMESWLKPDRGLPLDISHDSPTSTMQRTNPFAATRPTTYAAVESFSLAPDKLPPPPPTPGSPWASSGGRYHGDEDGSRYLGNRNDGGELRRGPRITTTTTATAGLSPPQPSGSRGRADTGELENASQSRIARQLQLLRNYRELAELCSNTKDPSVDLFRSLPAEELARMQAEQLQSLPQREQSPITVNNNYYFDGAGGGHRGTGGRGGHSSGRSGRSRLNSGDTVGALSKMGATGPSPTTTAAAAATATARNSRSVSELLTVDSHQGLTSHQPSGASSSRPLRPQLLPSPRMIPLQSPQPSSGPDSPVATPPLPPRGGTLATAMSPPPPPLQVGPPSPSRSYRARSHRSRHYDTHYTPTATTEEADSSYDDADNVDDGEEDYAGDFLDNDGAEERDDGQDADDYDDANVPHPPPRIIEREQHRRFPNNNGNGGGNYSTSNAQPPLAPQSLLQQQQQQQQQQTASSQYQQGSYPGDYMTNDISARATGTSVPSSAIPLGVAPRNSMGGGSIAGSDGGRRSVSSAINVLSGDQELRANAQLGASGIVDSRRGSVSQPIQSQQQQQQGQRHITAYNGNDSIPMSLYGQNPQRRRSLSAGSTPRHRRHDGGALTDPGVGTFSDAFSSFPEPRHEGGAAAYNDNSNNSRSNGGGGSRHRGPSTPEKRLSGISNGSSRAYLVGLPHGNNRDRSRNNNNNNNDYSYSGGGAGPTSAHPRGGGSGRGCDGDHNAYDNSSNGSDYMNDDLSPGSTGSDFSASEGDTPGNPQLQTHNPRSSAMRKRRQEQREQRNQRHNNSSSGVSRCETQAPKNALNGRGRQRDGWDDDGTVQTPRSQSLASRQRAAAAAGKRVSRVHRQQGAEPRRRHNGRRSSGKRKPVSPFHEDNGVELNSASTYSYSYTTSSDITDYVAGSYFSPVKEQSRMHGRGGGRSPMRGRGRGTGSPANNSYRMNAQQRQQQQRLLPDGYPVGPNARFNSPQRGRGSHGGAAMMNSGARGTGRCREGTGPNFSGNNNINPAMGGGAGGSPPYPYYNSAAPYGRARGGGAAGGMGGSPQLASHRAPGGLPISSGGGEGRGQVGNGFGLAGQRPLNRDPAYNNTSNAGASQSPRRAGTDSAAVGAGGNRSPYSPAATAQAPAASPSSSPASGFVQLPNGLTVPATSPAARDYLRMLQQLQQMPAQGQYPMGVMAPPSSPQQPQQPFDYASSNEFYPAGAASMSRRQLQMSTAPSLRPDGRAASPSITAGNVNAVRSTSQGGGVHVHPGLLYGSLLPKARPKTALVVEDDGRGREHSVDPHGDTFHEPFMEPGSVCPVQPAVPNSTISPQRSAFRAPPMMDVFPVTNAIHGTTAEGVQPLAWKSGGSGCVVGRSGHVPPPPATKLSSHYVPANTTQQQQQRRGAPVSGATSSVGGPDFALGSPIPKRQQGRLVVSIMQPQQHFNPLRQPTTSRRDSAYSLQSDMSSRAPQQRYVPLQEPLEPARQSGSVNYGGGRSPGVVDPYTPRGQAAAERHANLQRFGIAPVQG
jgi:hypothetical protein